MDPGITLALYDNRDPWDIGARLIKWWHSSTWSHCELVVGSYSYSSSIPDGGVRRIRTEEVFRNPQNWTFLPVQWGLSDTVLSFFSETESQPYGWSDLVKRQVLNIRGNDRGYFCSEWCASALGIPNPGMYGPQALKDIIVWANALSNMVDV